MINKFSFTIFTFSLLSVYTWQFQTWQFLLVKEKLACQIFLDKGNLPTILHLHEHFFLVKVNLSRKNCSCKWGFIQRNSYVRSHGILIIINQKSHLASDHAGSSCFRKQPVWITTMLESFKLHSHMLLKWIKYHFSTFSEGGGRRWRKNDSWLSRIRTPFGI